MEKRPFLACLLSSLAIGAQRSARAQETLQPLGVLRFASMELPPYGWLDAHGKKHGVIYELLDEIGRRSGMPYENRIMPFARMLRDLKEGRVDALSSQAHQEALDSGEPLAVTHLVNVIAVTKKGSGIGSLEDLKGKNVVFHQGASYKQLEGILGAVRYVNSYQQAVLLLHGRPDVHCAVFSEPAFHHFRQAAGLRLEDFGAVIDIERGKPQWLFVRHGLPQGAKDRLKAAVGEVFQEACFDRLLVKHGYIAR